MAGSQRRNPDGRIKAIGPIDLNGPFPTQSEAILGVQLDDILFDCARGAFHDLPQKPQSIATALLDQTIGEAWSRNTSRGIPNPILVDAIHARDQEVITGTESHRSRRCMQNLDIQQLSLDQRIDWIHLQAEAMGFIPANESDVSSAIDEIILENTSPINARGRAQRPPYGQGNGKVRGAAMGRS